jgi:plasmid rolling circle replication initiator protein Rep
MASQLARILDGTIEEKRSERMRRCAPQLQYRLQTQLDGTQKLKLQSAYFCRDPYCPICISGVSRARRRQVVKALPKLLKDNRGIRFISLVLTIKNPPIVELRNSIQSMHKAFTEMMRDKRVTQLGYIRALEVTIGDTGLDKCHPHFHILIAVPPNYFDKDKDLYLSQEQWSRLWAEKLGIDYTPVVHVSAVRENAKLSQSEVIGEIVKYCTKPTDLLADRSWTLIYISQTLSLKRITTAGIFRKYLKALESEPDDLIGKDDDEDLSGPIVTFLWDWDRRDYILVQSSEDSTESPFSTTKITQY